MLMTRFNTLQATFGIFTVPFEYSNNLLGLGEENGALFDFDFANFPQVSQCEKFFQLSSSICIFLWIGGGQHRMK